MLRAVLSLCTVFVFVVVFLVIVGYSSCDNPPKPNSETAQTEQPDTKYNAGVSMPGSAPGQTGKSPEVRR